MRHRKNEKVILLEAVSGRYSRRWDIFTHDKNGWTKRRNRLNAGGHGKENNGSGLKTN